MQTQLSATLPSSSALQDFMDPQIVLVVLARQCEVMRAFALAVCKLAFSVTHKNNKALARENLSRLFDRIAGLKFSTQGKPALRRIFSVRRDNVSRVNRPVDPLAYRHTAMLSLGDEILRYNRAALAFCRGLSGLKPCPIAVGDVLTRRHVVSGLAAAESDIRPKIGFDVGLAARHHPKI